mmetsp:Transcript_1550/g.4886  ORF Transcript_1550/g.4886 Transcript_1550/m.4886 type:complete len:323 (-) Transcript_1550:46-1014(-)
MIFLPFFAFKNSANRKILASTVSQILYDNSNCIGNLLPAPAPIAPFFLSVLFSFPPPAAAAAAAAFESLTVTRTGFRNPALANSSNSSVCVAENNPVLLCFGNIPIIEFRVFAKPIPKTLSASSNTNNSHLFASKSLAFVNTSNIRPGVPIKHSDPRSLNRLRSSATVCAPPPTNSIGLTSGLNFECSLLSSSSSSAIALKLSKNGSATSRICLASSLVGDTITAPIECFLNLLSLFAFHNISIIGNTNASVFPDPVHASTLTSLFFPSKPMTAACTGVEFTNARDLRIDKVCARRGGSNCSNGGPSATDREERGGGAIFFV